jgi:Holliday junction resolvasome RuvABC endonuclease subunit
MNVICLDAGFLNLGWVVAEVKKRGEPKIVDCGVSSAPPLSAKERKRRGLSAAHNNIARIEKQVDHLIKLHAGYTPRAYFVEVPHGGAKGAMAIRAMAYATATIVATLRALTVGTPVTYILPSEVKELVGGKTTASKAELASAVRNFWPDVDWDAPGKTKKDNMTDAGAVCLAMRFHQTFKAMMASC